LAIFSKGEEKGSITPIIFLADASEVLEKNAVKGRKTIKRIETVKIIVTLFFM